MLIFDYSFIYSVTTNKVNQNLVYDRNGCGHRYRIKLRTVLACAIMGFYMLMIDQANFVLIGKVEL